MAEKLLMLALSPTMEAGTIAAWKVKEGDEVKSGQILCEVETDKAVMEYESPLSGTLLKVFRSAGEKAVVGDLIAAVGKPGEDVSALAAEAALAGGAVSQTPAQASGTPPPAEPRSTGSTAPSAQSSPAGQVLLSSREAVGEIPAPGDAPRRPSGFPPSSPLARALAHARGLDLRAIRASGPGGRVVKRDVEAFVASGGAGSGGPVLEGGERAARPAPAAAEAPASDVRPRLVDRRIPISGRRAVIAKRLSQSMFSAPHYFLRAAVAMDGLLELRALLNAGRTAKLSLNAFIVKLAAEAMRAHPLVNASWGDEAIDLHGSVDIGLAVALPDGLITPIVRDCAAKGVAEIEAELVDLVARARAGGLQPREYSGASFTISNLGSYGVEEFTAIINPPGSAILALGEIRKEAVVRPDAAGGDAVAIRRMMRATLSCDHRVIDGAVGAEFLRDLKLYLQEPARAIL